jgi:hypothetical protein
MLKHLKIQLTEAFDGVDGSVQMGIILQYGATF